MKSRIKSISIILLVAAGIWTLGCSNANSAELNEQEIESLEACRDVINVFQQFPNSVWPGFDLARMPFIFYMPEKWTLLFNYSGGIDDFSTYPADWPAMNTNVLFHEGRLGNLAGQLSFDFTVDSLSVAAVPYNDKPAAEIFAFIVHENFHQFQKYGANPAFGEIPWQREEKYPIEDVENTSLAYLEMKLLMNALLAIDGNDRESCLDDIRQFTAVRNYRWHELDPFIGLYEQGQEINEGTAAYAENKALSLLAELYRNTESTDHSSSLRDDMASFSLVDHMIEDFQSRITDGSISPEDVPRNRIYPVGAAEGLLADYLGISWKESAQKAGEEFSFARLFREKLGISEDEFPALLQKAKTDYNYGEISGATKGLIAAYQSGFEKELAEFESQDGIRIDITLKSSGLWRSRSSSSKKWLAENGSRELRSNYNIYSLSADDLELQLTESGLLEQNSWDAGIRTISFFVPEIDTLMVNGAETKPAVGDTTGFQTLKISSANLNFRTSRPGTILWDNKQIKIDLAHRP